MSSLDDLQRLTPSQGALLYRLVELSYLTQTQVDDLINRLVSERFIKAAAFLDFAQQLDAEAVLNQPHIISRRYYAMYHAVRAVVLHTVWRDFGEVARGPQSGGLFTLRTGRLGHSDASGIR